MDKTAVHHIHHGGGHGDHPGKADQIPLRRRTSTAPSIARLPESRRYTPPRSTADFRTAGHGCAATTRPPRHRLPAAAGQNKKLNATMAASSSTQQRTAQQHLRGILGSIFHLRSFFSLSAPGVCPASCLFRQCSPRQSGRIQPTFVLYSQHCLCPENLNASSLSLFFFPPVRRLQLASKPQRPPPAREQSPCAPAVALPAVPEPLLPESPSAPGAHRHAAPAAAAASCAPSHRRKQRALCRWKAATARCWLRRCKAGK